MNVARYLRIAGMVLLLTLPMQAVAGKWAYRCMFFAGSRVTCDDIGDAADYSVTSAFTSKYPADRYLTLFTVSAFSYGNGSFSYSVTASLHAKRDKGRWLKFPLISGHAYGGYHSNPSFALQRSLLLQAVRRVTADLVSDVTGR